MAEHHRARRLALQGLCCLDVQGDEAITGAVDFIAEGRDKPQAVAEAQQMLRAASGARAQADELISSASRHWHTDRMAMVDRNILRLAVWELMADNAPPAVVIDEAVKLAKEFGAAESPRFVNGVLDAIAKSISSRDAGDAQDEKSS